MNGRRSWTRDELLVALNLYCQLPFGQLHSKNPIIISVAEKLARTPSSLAMKLTNIASLDPKITQSGRSGLKGASKLDKLMWDEMQQDWEQFAEKSEEALISINTENPIDHLIHFSEEDHTALTKVRKGQGLFRKAVLSAYENKCCITGLSEKSLLVASHIIPWKANKAHRLNPSNGLCLSNIHDRAFDQGLLTLNDHFEVLLSSKIKQLKGEFTHDCFEKYEGVTIFNPKKFEPCLEALSFHRDEIYQG